VNIPALFSTVADSATHKEQTMKSKSASIVTIHQPGSMTSKGRKDIAGWLRAVAHDLEQYGHLYTTGTFRSRYLYDSDWKPKKPKGRKA
jgi:hypothetical protein